MQPSQSFPVPIWVRCTICLTACVAVLGLIAAVYNRVEVGYPVSIVVGFIAIRCMNLAFRDST